MLMYLCKIPKFQKSPGQEYFFLCNVGYLVCLERSTDRYLIVGKLSRGVMIKIYHQFTWSGLRQISVVLRSLSGKQALVLPFALKQKIKEHWNYVIGEKAGVIGNHVGSSKMLIKSSIHFLNRILNIPRPPVTFGLERLFFLIPQNTALIYVFCFISGFYTHSRLISYRIRHNLCKSCFLSRSYHSKILEMVFLLLDGIP